MTDRKPAVAGLFYPANPGELAKTIAGFFSEVDKLPIDGHPLALIAPHAGYPYSGRVAAKAYKLLEGLEYDTVVVVSPSHTVFFRGASIYPGDAYVTPLGRIEVDRQLVREMVGINPAVHVSDKGHATGATRGEHALEVQLPFLQIVLGQFKLIPIVMGDQEEDTIAGLAGVLSTTLAGRRALMVASTDLSHFHSEKSARQLDASVQRAIERFDPDLLMETLEAGSGEACGGGPVAAVMTAARRLGANSVQFVDYTTSAQTTEDLDSVVGYLSAVVLRPRTAKRKAATIGSPAASSKKSEHLTTAGREKLIGIARQAISHKIQGMAYQPPRDESLDMRRGIFVTVTIGEQLRGCIGQVRARQPLWQAVADMAVAAAFEDPRFAPLTEAEYGDIEIEISVLTPLERVHNFDEIEVGRDGLMVKLDFHSGLLLPQVATENQWDRTTFLEQTCLKAGLPKNRYLDKHAEVYKFQTQVF
ncbi:MAG: AmmeMemoRadiSam system protein B [bacterium]